jgi:hypothetical protein
MRRRQDKVQQVVRKVREGEDCSFPAGGWDEWLYDEVGCEKRKGQITASVILFMMLALEVGRGGLGLVSSRWWVLGSRSSWRRGQCLLRPLCNTTRVPG